MIEDAMVFALGFLAAMLLALACLPAVWGRALRLTRRRLEMLVPLSADEIAAERDGIRAKAAVAHRQVEQKLEAALASAAQLAADLGHRTVRLVATERLLDEAREDGATTEAERARLAGLSVDLEAQLGALQQALHAADGALTEQVSHAAAFQARYATLEEQAEARRATIAALETRVAGLDARLEDRNEDVARASAEQQRVTALLAAAARDRDTARNESLLATMQRSVLQDQLQEERARSSERQTMLVAKSEALAEMERRNVELTAEIKASAMALSELRERFDKLQAKLMQGDAALEAGVNIDADELARLRQEIASLADDALLLSACPPRADEAAAAPRPPAGRTEAEALL